MWVKARVEIKEQPQTARQGIRIQHSLEPGVRHQKILTPPSQSNLEEVIGFPTT